MNFIKIIQGRITGTGYVGGPSVVTIDNTDVDQPVDKVHQVADEWQGSQLWGAKQTWRGAE